MSNSVSTTGGTADNHISCNAFDPETCLYKLPCGTCMMLKSACPHVLNKLLEPNAEQFKLPNLLVNDWNDTASVPDSCKHCPNHPSNGGSGVCHCTLGSWKVT